MLKRIMFGSNILFCLWLVILGTCFANNFEERFEKLERELKETKQELLETKKLVKQQTQIIDSLMKGMDEIKDESQISKPLCKFCIT